MKSAFVNYSVFKIMMLAIPVLIISCKNQDLQTVKEIDLLKYSGKWYEMASFPNSFQKGCSCTAAEYQLSDDPSYVIVINTCRKNGQLSTIKGKAFPVSNSGNSRLKVQFFWPFKGDYYIIALADDYSYVMVGHPNRKYLWILSRTKTMDEEVYKSLISKAQDLGFDQTKLVKTSQDCEQTDSL